MPIAGIALLCLAAWAGYGLLQLFAPRSDFGLAYGKQLERSGGRPSTSLRSAQDAPAAHYSPRSKAEWGSKNAVHQLENCPEPIRADAPAGVFLCLVAGVLALGWLAFTLAEIGAFSTGTILIVGLIAGAGGRLAARRRGSRIALNPIDSHRKEVAFLGALIVVTGVLYFRPHEFIFGGADAGVYVNLGAQVQRSGSWLISNPDLAALPADDYTQVFREQPPEFLPRFYYLPGFYVADDAAGRIIPQFYALHPIWLAMAHALGGVQANLLMTPLWGVLGVLAVYFAVRESFDDRRLAAVAAGLLALTPTQIWFARYPTAEVLTQFLLFAGLFAFARWARHGDAASAFLAGAALGQVTLVRIDMYFLLGVLPVYAAYLHLQRRLDRQFWVFALPMLAMSGHSLIHAVWQAGPYLHNTYFSGGPPSTALIAAAIGGLLLAILAFMAISRARGGPTWTRLVALQNPIRSAAALGVIALALYAYFVAPTLADPAKQALYWYGQNIIPDVEPFNFVRLGWYLTPLGLALGAIGAAFIFRERIDRYTWLIVGVGAFFSLLYIYRTFNNPHHVYVMRRYVPAVIPAFALGMAFALIRLADRNRLGRVLAAGLLVVQIGLMVYAGRTMIRQIDYAGGVAQYQAFAAQIPAKAVVLFNDDEPVGVSALFGTPLAYLDGFTVIDVQEDRLDFQQLDRLVGGWRIDRPVIVVEGPSRVSGLCDRWQCRRLGQAWFDFPTLEASYDHFPTEIVQQQYALDLYAVEAVR